ncbi:MMPL family transporter [Actinomadura fulvescens]|uniref:Membrane transport protein MMPL domain-containing protein n=1 Tax=Actinomadura fulvescens TaxID=46160 RepID=A0ABN3QVF6_9ACTN
MSQPRRASRRAGDQSLTVLTQWSVRQRHLVLAVAAVVALLAPIPAAAAAGRLAAGAAAAPHTASADADAFLDRRFPQDSEPDLTLRVAAGAAVDSPEVAADGRRLTQLVSRYRGVTKVRSYWPRKPADLRSRDHRAALVLVKLSGDASAQARTARRLVPAAARVSDGLEVTATGNAWTLVQQTQQLRHELPRAALIAVALSAVALLLIIGPVYGALAPVLMAALAAAGALASLWPLSRLTLLPLVALPLAGVIAFGLALYFGLLIVSRYRRELAAGADMEHALERSLVTAGHTAACSAVVVAATLAALLVLPVDAARILALAALFATGAAAAVTLVVLPALLAVIGSRIQRGDMFARLRRRSTRAVQTTRSVPAMKAKRQVAPWSLVLASGVSHLMRLNASTSRREQRRPSRNATERPVGTPTPNRHERPSRSPHERPSRESSQQPSREPTAQPGREPNEGTSQEPRKKLGRNASASRSGTSRSGTSRSGTRRGVLRRAVTFGFAVTTILHVAILTTRPTGPITDSSATSAGRVKAGPGVAAIRRRRSQRESPLRVSAFLLLCYLLSGTLRGSGSQRGSGSRGSDSRRSSDSRGSRSQRGGRSRARQSAKPQGAPSPKISEGFGERTWRRVASVSTRRPVVLGCIGMLLAAVVVMAAPQARLSLPDERVLPTNAQSHSTAQRIQREFDFPPDQQLKVILPDLDADDVAERTQLERYARNLAKIPGVQRVRTVTGSYDGTAPGMRLAAANLPWSPWPPRPPAGPPAYPRVPAKRPPAPPPFIPLDSSPLAALQAEQMARAKKAALAQRAALMKKAALAKQQALAQRAALAQQMAMAQRGAMAQKAALLQKAALAKAEMAKQEALMKAEMAKRAARARQTILAREAALAEQARRGAPPSRYSYLGATLVTVSAARHGQADHVLDRVRTADAPSRTLITGAAARAADTASRTSQALPLAVLAGAFLGLALLFLFSGGVLAAFKGILLSALAPAAACAALVVTMQDATLRALTGHLSPVGFLDATALPPVLAVAAGLAVAHTALLLAGTRRLYETGLSHPDAIAAGAAQAAIPAFSAVVTIMIPACVLATSGSTVVRMVGLGLAAALIADAVVVRLLLAPAFLRLGSAANWRAPGPLARLYEDVALTAAEPPPRTPPPPPPRGLDRLAAMVGDLKRRADDRYLNRRPHK